MSNNSSHNPELFDCKTSTDRYIVGGTFDLVKVTLLAPLYTFILYLGVQKWKQQRSFATASHSDIFIYNQAALVVFIGLASVFFLCTTVPHYVSSFFFDMNVYGENYFQVLTCVEQYLAVVHPIVYRGLRNARGVRIRNISIGCVWLLTFISATIAVVFLDPKVPYIFMIPFAICLVAVSFCCLSVRFVLNRPGPGEGTRVDQSKQRAFNTITGIFAVLVLWLGGILSFCVLYIILPVKYETKCVMVFLSFWFNLPSGLVLPLLYLHRAGKLSFCCHNNG